MDSDEILNWRVLLESVVTFQFWLQSGKNNGHFYVEATCISVRVLGVTGYIYFILDRKMFRTKLIK